MITINTIAGSRSPCASNRRDERHDYTGSNSDPEEGLNNYIVNYVTMVGYTPPW